MHDSNEELVAKTLNRRQMMTGLAMLSVAAPAVIQASAQAKSSVSALEGASDLLGEHFTPEQLKMISTALQRNFEQFENVRTFDVPDSIEPALVFLPLRYAEHPPVSMNIALAAEERGDNRG